MGIESWFPFAEDNGIQGQKISQEQCKALHVEIDLLGLFYWLNMSSLHKDDVAQSRTSQAPPPATATTPLRYAYATPSGYSSAVTREASVTRAARDVHYALSRSFDPQTSRVHLDGGRTAQKQDRHKQRDEKRGAALDVCIGLSLSNLAAAQRCASKQNNVGRS